MVRSYVVNALYYIQGIRRTLYVAINSIEVTTFYAVVGYVDDMT